MVLLEVLRFVLVVVVIASARASEGYQIVEDGVVPNAERSPLLHPAFVSELNSKPKSWIAGLNEVFDKLTEEEVRSVLACAHRGKPSPSAEFQSDLFPDVTLDLPANFDWREKMAECVHPIRNQMRCGSCWAFAGTEALSDRICIGSRGIVNVVLSPEELVSCDPLDLGCGGGWLQNAWEFMTNPGVPTDLCVPYSAGNGSAPQCPKRCSDGSPMVRYKVKRGTINSVADPALIQKAILLGGPVEASFIVYKDFPAYQSGVYAHTTEEALGAHAVKIIGWGEEVEGLEKTPYWLIANSWGTTWGENGFFKMLRGKDESAIEDNIVFGDPDLTDLML
mmetsp:Transcript_19749/g.32368  ORF Transcript_19749/g.32368 Transcript_19749/m.32368 type:complete len:336 (-) Transcript_19749:467-1474(-)